MKDSAISEHPAQRGLRFAAMVVAALLAGCSQKQAAPPRPAAPVTVAMVGERDIPLDITAIGNVEPVQTVQIRSMVNGQVDEVLFKEGQEVRKGDLLFKLDQRPFLADLDRNIAMLHKDEAQAANSQTQSVRYDALEKQGVISKELGDQQRTQARADASLVNSDKAAVEASRVQLQYSEIRSPIDAKTGSLLVTKGNLVKANDTPYLVQLNQIAPIYATFTVPETELATVKEYAAARRKVLAFAKGETSNPSEGILTFIDNMVDTSTGTTQQILDRSPDAARQLASRARRRVRGAPAPDTDLARQRELVQAFLEASRNGDFDALVEVLAPDVVFRVRGDSVPSATVHGRDQAARRALARGSRLAHLGRPAIVNGGAGILVGPLDDPIAVVAMTIADGLIATVDVIVRPRLAG